MPSDRENILNLVFGIISIPLGTNLKKTINCCEGFHNSLYSFFNFNYPNIWKLFDWLEMDIKMEFLLLGNLNGIDFKVIKKSKYERINTFGASEDEKYFDKNNKLKYLRQLAYIQ